MAKHTPSDDDESKITYEEIMEILQEELDKMYAENDDDLSITPLDFQNEFKSF